MKTIQLPAAELKAALAGLGKVIIKRPPLAILGNIRVRQLAAGRIDLTVTDLSHSATYVMDCAGFDQAVTILVPFDHLNNVARSCSATDVITVESSADHEVIIRFPVGGRSTAHHCEAAPAAEFPFVHEFSEEGLPLNNALRDSMLEALECASLDPSRPLLNGVFIDVGDKQAHYVVGSDGNHLYSSNSFTLPLTESTLIPAHKFLKWKGFQQDGGWSLRTQPDVRDHHPALELATDHWRFQSRLIEGVYPKWKEVVPSPTSFQTSINIDPESLDEVTGAIHRVPVDDDRHQTIGLRVADGRCFFLGRSKTDASWTQIDFAGAAVSGPEVTVFCDRRKVLKALRFGLTRIEIINPQSPLRCSRFGRQMILMPLRLIAPESPTSPPMMAADHPQPDTSNMQTNSSPSSQSTASVPLTCGKSTKPKEETKSSLDSALVQIESIKTSLREGINSLSRLGDHVRQAIRDQKASEKEVHNVRQTLRSLQGLRI